jgi:hypothetical protein
MLIAKIDLTKVDRTKLFPGKNGAKYLDLAFIETPNNQYGDSHMVVQSVSKEDRAKGIKGAILGNAKTIGGNAPASPAPSGTAPTPSNAPVTDDELPPF